MTPSFQVIYRTENLRALEAVKWEPRKTNMREKLSFGVYDQSAQVHTSR